MTSLSLSPTIDMLKNALTGADIAHGAFAHNIANVNTPNFHRTTVSFKSELAEAAGMNANSDDLMLATNSPSDINAPKGMDDFTPNVTIDDSTKMRQDNNNVDVDQEMANLSQNADYGSMGTQILKNQYTLLREVIMEQ